MYVFKTVFIYHANYSAPLSFATGIIIIALDRRNPVFWLCFFNTKGADQPAHPRSLISSLVIRLLESIISRLAPREIILFMLFTVAEQVGFGMT